MGGIRMSTSNIKTYQVYIIQCYDQQTDRGELLDATICELIDTSPEKAMKRAKKLIQDKKFYRLSRVIEKEIT